MNKNLIIGLGIVLVIALLGMGAVWAFSDKTSGVPAQPTATSTDTSASGGGVTTTTTTVTTSTTTPEKESDTAALGQRIYKFGVHITPLEVVQDSRCPTDVQCIRAGDVTIKAKLENGTTTQIVTMVTGSPVSFGNKHVTLMSVSPAKNSKTTIKPSDYRFTFSVAYGMGGNAP